MKARILVVEDDAGIRKLLEAILTLHDFEFLSTATGREGLELTATAKPDLIILDLGLGDMDGTEVARGVRGSSRIPIIVLSGRGREGDKGKALAAGADDFVSKPFEVKDLIDRIRTTLQQPRQALYSCRQLKVDLETQQVFVAGAEIPLSDIEYKLLALLVRRAGKVVTHEQALAGVWGPEYVYAVPHLKTQMARLRRKLEKDPAQPQYLLTEQGIGYRLVDE